MWICVSLDDTRIARLHCQRKVRRSGVMCSYNSVVLSQTILAPLSVALRKNSVSLPPVNRISSLKRSLLNFSVNMLILTRVLLVAALFIMVPFILCFLFFLTYQKGSGAGTISVTGPWITSASYFFVHR